VSVFDVSKGKWCEGGFQGEVKEYLLGRKGTRDLMGRVGGRRETKAMGIVDNGQTRWRRPPMGDNAGKGGFGENQGFRK